MWRKNLVRLFLRSPVRPHPPPARPPPPLRVDFPLLFLPLRASQSKRKKKKETSMFPSSVPTPDAAVPRSTPAARPSPGGTARPSSHPPSATVNPSPPLWIAFLIRRLLPNPLPPPQIDSVTLTPTVRRSRRQRPHLPSVIVLSPEPVSLSSDTTVHPHLSVVDAIIIRPLKATPSLDPSIHVVADTDAINHTIPYAVWPELALVADRAIRTLPPLATHLGARVPQQGGFQDT